MAAQAVLTAAGPVVPINHTPHGAGAFRRETLPALLTVSTFLEVEGVGPLSPPHLALGWQCHGPTPHLDPGTRAHLSPFGQV